MIDPIFATIIILVFIIIFGVGVPVLNKKAPKYISYRWSVIVVILGLLIGAVVDFKDLSDESRKIVLIGGLIIGGVYVLLRTIEKILSNGWLHGSSIVAKKGDISLQITSHQEDEKKERKDKKENNND